MSQWLANRQDGAPDGDAELRMIPRWSMALAIALFIGMQYIFHVVMPHHKHEMLPLRLMMGYAWGTMWASYALLLGYVSRDVKRRGMRREALDAGLLCAPRRHWRRGLFHAAPADPDQVPALHDHHRFQLSLLPPMPVSARTRLRHMPPQYQDHRRLLHAVWSRPRPGWCARSLESFQRLGGNPGTLLSTWPFR